MTDLDLTRRFGLTGSWVLTGHREASGDVGYQGRAIGEYRGRRREVIIGLSREELETSRWNRNELLSKFQNQLRSADNQLTKTYRPSRFMPARKRTRRLYP